MNWYITFSGATYHETTQEILNNAPRMGAEKILVYDDIWLMEQEFYRLNKWLWEHTGVGNPTGGRGFGWFAWKSFIILETLKKMQVGDIVLYTDGDTYPIHDFSMLYSECARIGGTMLFSATGCENQFWCKRDCLVVMGQDSDKYRFCQHAVARFMLFQKGPWKVEQFLMEWLTYCLNPLAQTFDPSTILPEYPELTEHRTEQAILTLLAHKYGHKLYREACQYAFDQPEDQDLYPQLFIQKGMRSGNKKPLIGSAFRNV